MKRVLAVVFALVLLVGSLSVTVIAQEQGRSPIKACVALGFSPAVCATCFVAGITHDAEDYGACYCKYDEGLRSRFETMGKCVEYVQKTLRPSK